MKREIRCACGHFFQVEEAAAGGYVNCLRCQKAVQVPGLEDPLWRLLQVIALLAWGAATYVAGVVWGVSGAVLTAIVVALVLWLISRAL